MTGKSNTSDDYAARIAELEQKCAELTTVLAVVRNEAERFQSLFDNAPISLWIQDFSRVKEHIDQLKESGITDFRDYFDRNPDEIRTCASLVNIVDVNTTTLKMYGAQTKADLLSYFPRVLTHNSYQVFTDELCTIIEGASTFESEVIQQTFAGETFYVNLHLALVAGFETSWKKVVVSLTDVSSKRQTEVELERTKSLLLAAIENSPAGIIIADAPDVRIRFANSAALGIRGHANAPLSDIPMELHPEHWQVYHPGGAMFKPDDLPLTRAVLAGVTTHNLEAIIRRENSEDRWVLVNAAPVRNAQNEIVAGVVVFPDITELKQYEQALRESEEKFRSIVESSPMGILMYTLTEDDELILIGTNNAASAILGLDITHLTGMSILDAFPSLAETNIPDQYREICRSGKPWQTSQVDYEDEYIKGAYEVHAFKTAPDMIAVLFLDITDRLRSEKEKELLQNQLRQAQKMEAVGTLAGGVAHDFNNLLTTIIGGADLLADYHTHNQEALSLSNDIRDAGIRASNLTRQLLAFSRKQVFEARVVDINVIVADLQKMLQRLIRENIAFTITRANRELFIKADPTQIEQVIINLVINARDAMPEGGTLTIDMRERLIDESFCRVHPELSPGPHACVSVADTGYGMTKELQEKIFEPFFTTKEIGKGTGLGLAMVYGIVKQHGGCIMVESAHEKGTVFTMFFPLLAETVEEAVLESAVNAAALHSETILVVEDEIMVLNIVALTLTELGFTVLTARNAPEARAAVIENRDTLHLVITDVIMPDKNGKELYTELASLCPGLKVLFMSGYSESIISHDGILESGFNFIQKPFTSHELSAKLDEILG